RDLIVTGVQTCALPICAQEVREGVDVHAWRRDVRPDPVNHEAKKGEEELFLELRDLEQIGNRITHAIVPPACSILVLALADTARSEERRVGKECRWRWA